MNHNPLDALPFMTVWRECVWAARISAHAKLVLIRVAGFVDAEGNGSSFSYAKLAWDCNLSVRQVKYVVKALRNVWLRVHTAGGRLVPRIGRENLYDVIAPRAVIDDVREHRMDYLREQITVAVKGDGVHAVHPVRGGRGVPLAQVHGDRRTGKNNLYGNCFRENAAADATWERELAPGITETDWTSDLAGEYVQ